MWPKILSLSKSLFSVDAQASDQFQGCNICVNENTYFCPTLYYSLITQKKKKKKMKCTGNFLPGHYPLILWTFP